MPAARKPTPDELDRILNRGVAEVIPRQEFIDRLNDARPLRLKMGFDPSAPDLHLGHVVGLRKLRQLQDLGHTVVVIVGDWTARIGDPSGRSETRPMLTADQVQRNADTYMRQFFSVVDRERSEVRYQSEWFDPFDLATVMRLTAEFTLNQFLHRDDFGNRYAAGSPIAIVELLYPLLQAYDSVAVQADVEFGGTDQKFNLLVGRDLLEKRGMRPQDVFLVPILPGTDGVRRMGKSLGNYVAIEDPPNDQYGKLMSIPDNVLPLYYELLTDCPDDELQAVAQAANREIMDAKKRLADLIVTQFHGPQAAQTARAEFERVIQHRQPPTTVPDFPITPATDGLLGIEPGGAYRLDLPRFLVAAGLAQSRSEAARLIAQSAVQINGQPQTARQALAPPGALLQVGRRRALRLL